LIWFVVWSSIVQCTGHLTGDGPILLAMAIVLGVLMTRQGFGGGLALAAVTTAPGFPLAAAALPFAAAAASFASRSVFAS
jgi:hypothetical protein